MITNKNDKQIYSEIIYDPYEKTVNIYTYDKNGHQKFKTVKTYNSDDNICFETTYDANNKRVSEIEHTYDCYGNKVSKIDSKYDEQGRVISSTEYDANDQITMHAQIRYNTLGTKLSKKAYTYLKGELLFITNFTYAHDGRLVSEVQYSPEGKKMYQDPRSTIINKLAILGALLEIKVKQIIPYIPHQKDGLSWSRDLRNNYQR